MPVDEQLVDRIRERFRRAGHLRQFRRGDFLCTAGTASDEVLLIESGSVKVVLHGQNGADSILGFYGPGDVLGELGVVWERRRSANVVARTAGTATHVDARTFKNMLTDGSEVLRFVNALLQKRLLLADRRQERLASMEAPVRVARQLLDLARVFGERVERGLQVSGLTQLELAQSVTASAKTVDLALKQLRADGLLRTRRCQYLLPDPELLERRLDDPDWRPGR
ncbi:Crp/Fnr family transcriptional regulator [Kutzneria viridogrisea]|uniref:Uncharacterized protein n=2 Tax=Kutzneria TaxID=43356 RepID=W5W6Q3_9PSEU|nr:Crp/Fnr family transcriptional regulator [Kutzneria albida]AHH96161.1 hypothetical protein KALB_2793 [Kutzneria albida DSM 43870]MBA8928627.1 CRP/FNR family cyclic AMP-dependent transcriptional regulator [Kutzneria viridogrisea]